MYITSTTSLASESSNQIGRPISLMRFNRRRQSSTGLVILRQGEREAVASVTLICAPLTNRQQPDHTPKKIRLFDYLIFVFVFCVFLSRRCLATRRARRQFLLFLLSFGSEKKKTKQVAISVYLYRQTSVVFVWLLLAEPGRSLSSPLCLPADALVGSLIIKFRFSLSATVARERERDKLSSFSLAYESTRRRSRGLCINARGADMSAAAQLSLRFSQIRTNGRTGLTD